MFRQVKHDFEVFGQYEGEKQRIQLPETVKMYEDYWCDLNEDWQWYWFRLLIHSWSGYRFWDEHRLTGTELRTLKSAWRSLMDNERALTNGHGAGNCADYINGENLGGCQMAEETLTMGGNVVRVVGAPVVMSGLEYMPVETLNPRNLPPDIAVVNRLTRPDLIHVCTNVADIPQEVDPFPQLGGRDVPFPFVSKRQNWIRTRRLKEITTYPPRAYYP